MNSTGKFIQFLMPVTIYLMDSIQIGTFIWLNNKIFQLTKAYMLTLLLIYLLCKWLDLTAKRKKIGGSILTSMAELIFNSFLFKNFLVVPQKILLTSYCIPIEIHIKSTMLGVNFPFRKKHNISSISLTHKRKKEFQFSSSFPILLLILCVQTAGSKWKSDVTMLEIGT